MTPTSSRLKRAGRYTKTLPTFTYACGSPTRTAPYPNKGYVTRYIEPEHLNGGDVDVYLCGPPPMVDAVRSFLTAGAAAASNFYYEKFSGTGLVVETGSERLKPVEVDEALRRPDGNRAGSGATDGRGNSATSSWRSSAGSRRRPHRR